MINFLTQSAAHLRPLLLNRGAAVGSVQETQFADGELYFRLLEDVRRKSVTLIGSVMPDPTSLFELQSVFRLLRENKSLNPSLVIPYLGYARQDRPTREGESAIGVMVAEIIRNLNPAKLVVVDAHSQAILDALGPHAENRSAVPLFAELLSGLEDRSEVIVAPDAGAETRARLLAEQLGADVAVIDKVRPKPNAAQAKSIRGDVEGRHVLIFDDMIDTGGTIVEAVKLVSKRGALSIRVAATHGIFSREARDKLVALPIRDLIVTNTLPQPRHAKIRVLDVTPLLLGSV